MSILTSIVSSKILHPSFGAEILGIGRTTSNFINFDATARLQFLATKTVVKVVKKVKVVIKHISTKKYIKVVIKVK